MIKSCRLSLIKGGIIIDLNLLLVIVAFSILVMIVLNTLSFKIGVPTLLLFILLGMAVTNPNLFNVDFHNFGISEIICSISLIFIMFYGGFGTRWKEAKWVSKQSILLASLGVVLTALTVTFFLNVFLNIGFKESFLIGSVISSTDAASVFSIIRSRKLALRHRTSALLELESGSNDPASYMLTIIALALISGNLSPSQIGLTLLSQIGFGIGFGAILSWVSVKILQSFNFKGGLDTVFIFGMAILAYALPQLVNGNGYLSTYIVGIVVGNSEIRNKIQLVHFFDGVTGLTQMLLFFLLGLLSNFDKILSSLPLSLAIFLFLTFIGRPLVVESIMSFFKSPKKQKAVVGFAGLRGAASIVFAIMAHNQAPNLSVDIFHITFGIVLFSILIQGGLIPVLAKKLDMTDALEDPLKTFTDYSEERPIEFITVTVDSNHYWINKKLSDITIHLNLLLVLIIRGDQRIIPKGDTVILADDKLVFIARTFLEGSGIALSELTIDENHRFINKSLKELHPKEELVLLIKRGDQHIIPSGNDILLLNDEIIYIDQDTLLS